MDLTKQIQDNKPEFALSVDPTDCLSPLLGCTPCKGTSSRFGLNPPPSQTNKLKYRIPETTLFNRYFGVWRLTPAEAP